MVSAWTLGATDMSASHPHVACEKPGNTVRVDWHSERLSSLTPGGRCSGPWSPRPGCAARRGSARRSTRPARRTRAARSPCTAPSGSAAGAGGPRRPRERRGSHRLRMRSNTVVEWECHKITASGWRSSLSTLSTLVVTHKPHVTQKVHDALTTSVASILCPEQLDFLRGDPIHMLVCAVNGPAGPAGCDCEHKKRSTVSRTRTHPSCRRPAPCSWGTTRGCSCGPAGPAAARSRSGARTGTSSSRACSASCIAPPARGGQRAWSASHKQDSEIQSHKYSQTSTAGGDMNIMRRDCWSESIQTESQHCAGHAGRMQYCCCMMIVSRDGSPCSSTS